MKLVKEHINEKFIEDSDPIKDLGVGIMSFREKRAKIFNSGGSFLPISTWLSYLDSLIGKTIEGKFENVHKKKRFKISHYESYLGGININFYDNKGNRYRVNNDEKYIIE